MSEYGEQRYTPVPGMGLPSSSRGVQAATADGARPQEMSQRDSSMSIGLDPGDLDSRYPSVQHPSSSPTPTYIPRSESRVPLMTQRPSQYSMSSSTPQSFSRGYAHQNIPSEQYYPASDPATAAIDYAAIAAASRARKNRRRWIIGGVVLAILAVIGIIIGVVVAKVDKSDGDGDNSASTSSANTTSTLSDSSDPSDFTKDSNLHQSFYGFAYTPNLAQLPDCGITQANTTRDIQLLSQLTTRLRLYGANCNQTAMVMQAIQDTQAVVDVDSNDTAYTDQLSAVSDVLTTYGTDHISVGNEYILDTAGTDSLTDSTYLAAVKTITDKVAEVNSTVQALGLNKTLPIGTSDAGSVMSTTLGEGVDYFMANVHPYWGSVAIDDAATWTYEFYEEYDVEVAAEASNNPTTYIAETGWPSQSMNSSDASDGAGSPQGDASIDNLQTFLDTFVCQANANGTAYFYFEAFDEPWKEEYGSVEPYWGLFDSDRNLKNITIPTCS